MEEESDNHKPTLLQQQIIQQFEFYFSESNLLKDKFLKPLVEGDPEGC